MKDQIYADYIEAMKAKNRQKSEALKMFLAALKDEQIDSKEEMNEEAEAKVLRKELKKRQDALEMYQKASRDDLASRESYEIDLINDYLPAQLSREKVEEAVNEVTAANPDLDFGPLMGQVMSKLKGQADGKLVQEVLREKLNK
jgi:hypothetical protein